MSLSAKEKAALAAYIEQAVSAAPPLTAGRKESLRSILAPETVPGHSQPPQIA